MRRRLALTAAVMAMVTAACGGNDKPSASGGGATVPTAAPTTTTTDPFAIPATIDAAYVNRILAGLDAGVGDVVRLVVSTKVIPREAADRLRALYYDDTIMQRKIDVYQADIRGGLSGYRLPAPGNKKSDTVELLSTSRSCIYAKVRRDFTPVSVSTIPEVTTQWVAMKPLNTARDPFGYNKVGWAFAYEGFEPGFVPPAANPCAGV